MNARAILASILLTTLAAHLHAAPTPIDPQIRFYGRWDRRQPDRAITVCGGSYIIARFDARSLKARFDLARNKPPLPTINWRIDEQSEQPRESEIAESVELAKDLTPGPHTIRLIVRGLDEHQPRWAEPLTASITFLGFELPDNGKWIDPPADPKLKIEFLGDSITEGVLVHSKSPGRETWPWLTDAVLAYPTLTGMKIKDAQWRQVGFGAVGLTKTGSGGVPPTPESFDWFYQGCPRDDWQADVVVVNFGTNDRGASSETFRAAYAKQLALIRKAYPNAKILSLRPFVGAHADDIKSEVASRNQSGDANVMFVDTTGWLDRADYTDGVHPNVGGGPKVAEKLSKVIENAATQR